jgi:hypothetical protein
VHRVIVISLLACALPAAAQDLPNWYEVAGGQWNVPMATVRDAASHVQEAADQAPWRPRGPRAVGDYRVQYQGAVKDGKKLVRLMGACRTDPGQGDPAAQWLVVFDGGTCYYRAEYDPATKAFVYFAFNGMG